MLVSFVVATYDCEARAGVLLDTVRALRGFPCEFCVSDGGSRDRTLDLLGSTPEIRIVRSGRDRGIYDAWNLAIDACRGKYLAFIGVDDEPQPDFLRKALALTVRGDEPAFVYGDTLLRNVHRVRVTPAPRTPRLFEAARPVFDVPHPASLNHRALFERERFDPSFRLAGDLHFYLRVREQVRRQGYVKLGALQAVIEASGVSRSSKAFSTYRREYAAIEASLGVTLGYSDARLRALSLFERAPRLFDAVKWASWQLRGESRG